SVCAFATPVRLIVIVLAFLFALTTLPAPFATEAELNVTGVGKVTTTACSPFCPPLRHSVWPIARSTSYAVVPCSLRDTTLVGSNGRLNANTSSRLLKSSFSNVEARLAKRSVLPSAVQSGPPAWTGSPEPPLPLFHVDPSAWLNKIFPFVRRSNR